MNIFEQYGIRDVADVTLYSITYDKYDNEVYVPVIYFDTLKVSSVEQSAEQTAARGGLGNAEHVIWDYNKEINVTLQDALYTPASQNLLWGGFYGLKNMRIKGYWDEYSFTKDEYGKPIYYTKEIEEREESPGPEYVEFICPCDDTHKWITFKPAVATKHPVAGIPLSRFNKDIKINENKVDVYMSSLFTNTTLKPAEIIVNNFTNFTHSVGEISETNEEYNVTIKDYESPRNYKEIHSKNYKVNIDEVYRLLEYRWNGCDMSMSTNSNNIDLAFAENVDFVYHSHYDNNNKRLLFAIKDEEDKQPTQYTATLEFSLHFDKTITNANGEEVIIPITVPVGKFYIAEDLNIPQPEEEYAIYNITDNSKRVKYIDTTTKLVAPDTFAIDVDKNIMSYQYSQMPQYAQTELAVFLDPNTLKPFENNSIRYTTQKGLTITGNLRVIRRGEVYYKWQRRKISDNYAQGRQIVVDAKTFPGAFRLVGETYIRDRFGKEQKLQIEIPLCKLSGNTSLSLAADGEPVTVDMSLRAMRKHDGTLVKFTYYDVDKNCLVPFEAETIAPPVPQIQLTIQSPLDTELYCLPQDCQPPYNGKEDTYIRFEGTLGAATPAREICSILYSNEDKSPITPEDLDNLINNTTITIKEVTKP